MNSWGPHVMVLPMLALWRGRKTGLAGRKVGHCDWSAGRLGQGPDLRWDGHNPDLRDISEE